MIIGKQLNYKLSLKYRRQFNLQFSYYSFFLFACTNLNDHWINQMWEYVFNSMHAIFCSFVWTSANTGQMDSEKIQTFNVIAKTEFFCTPPYTCIFSNLTDCILWKMEIIHHCLMQNGLLLKWSMICTTYHNKQKFSSILLLSLIMFIDKQYIF